jgi:hypothetical protein
VCVSPTILLEICSCKLRSHHSSVFLHLLPPVSLGPLSFVLEALCSRWAFLVSIFYLFFGGTGVSTQGFMHTTSWAKPSVHFALVILEMRVSQTLYSGWPWTMSLSTSASQVAMITSMNHQHPPWFPYFIWFLFSAAFPHSLTCQGSPVTFRCSLSHLTYFLPSFCFLNNLKLSHSFVYSFVVYHPLFECKHCEKKNLICITVDPQYHKGVWHFKNICSKVIHDLIILLLNF